MSRAPRQAAVRSLPSGSGDPGEETLRAQAAILAEIRDGIVVTDAQGRITYWNDGATEIFGYTSDQMLGRTPDVLYPPDAQPGPRLGIEINTDWRGLHKDGSSVWVRLHARPILDGEGRPVGGIGLVTDVSERKAADAERQQLVTAVEQSTESVVITDATARITYVNPAFERLTGYSRDEVIGQNPRILKSGVQSSTFYDAMWAAISNGLPWVADMTNRRKDGSYFQEEAVFTPLKDETGTITGYVAVKRDVTRERALEAAGAAATRERALIAGTLRRLPHGMDPETTGSAVCQQVVSLTGLTHAHLFLFDDGHAFPIGLATDDGWSIAALPLDEDRTHHLRDRAAVGPWIEDWTRRPGHPYDEFLASLGVRAAAYVPVRSGGSLIGLLIAGSRDASATMTLTAALSGLLEFSEVAGALLGPALAARSASAVDRRRIEAVIAGAAFSPVFQPIVDLATREVRGFEALTRFDDGTPPDRMFAEARRLGIELDLEAATLGGALDAARDLPPDRFLDLNASPGLILERHRLHQLIATVSRPIVIEVTEHASVEDYAELRAAWADLGPDTRLAVDDAGAGAANFHHLVGLRPSFVKVDRGLIHGVDTDPSRQALIVALLHFASATSCRVIAEGIETEAELAILQQLGVELGQGFLVGRPAAAAAWAPAGVGRERQGPAARQSQVLSWRR